MEMVRREEVIVKDGQIRLTGLPYKRGDRVEVILLRREREPRPRVRLTAGQLRRSGLIGLWKDRTDIEDSSAYARRLRKQAQQRGGVG
ncbi:MAG: hypothetical protein D6759_15545 [Chloroflexi bacterium]|nr:MAG: hypothetical protein D6759_15545 [Chloroflexota bacterium]